jgi:aspartate/glutamate racemase
MYADKVKAKIDVPLIHIADAAANEIKKLELNKVTATWHQVHNGNGFL